MTTPFSEIPASTILEAIVRGILETGDKLVLDGSLVETVGEFVDKHSLTTLGPFEILKELSEHIGPNRSLLDFGCGTGQHRKAIEDLGYQWSGISCIEAMAEDARSKAYANPDITLYEGVHMPFEDNSFDLIFSNQVFEHCTSFYTNFAEISRILKPGGYLAGSVSYLEQMHDYSAFNFTPYGLIRAAKQSGMKVLKIYPSYDVFTWMLRRLVISTRGIDENSLSSILRRDNEIAKCLEIFAAKHTESIRDINLFKLLFSAHISFIIANNKTCGDRALQ